MGGWAVPAVGSAPSRATAKRLSAALMRRPPFRRAGWAGDGPRPRFDGRGIIRPGAVAVNRDWSPPTAATAGAAALEPGPYNGLCGRRPNGPARRVFGMIRRQDMLDRLRCRDPWDLIVIGGGATGLGTALDAAARGYRTLLLEAFDYAKGTSSRSTKLIHGGVRYLAQGRVGLVREALRERALLRNNAPHIVHDLTFLVPAYSWGSLPFYGLGLKLYDL